jgi:hypothetical protein
VTVANHFVEAASGARWVLADGETQRVDLRASLPLPGGREVRVEVPLLARVPGLLDAPIEAWHDLLGLPDGPRVDYRRGRVRILVGSDSSSAGPPLLVREMGSAAGLGDVSAELIQRIPSRSSRFAAAARVSVELPTGRASDLLGSGSLDAAGGLAGTLRLGGAVWVHGSGGVSLLGGGTWLPVELPDSAAGAGARLPRRASTAAHGALALEWRAARAWSAVAQLQAESAPWSVGVDVLDRPGLALAVGARGSVSSALELEAGLSEDLNVVTAPDLTLHAGLAWSPP